MQPSPSIKIWLKAFRLRTLPLALSSIGMGSFLAAFHQGFRWHVLILAALTTLFLQILSNLANDYGDSQKGTDNENRIGPARTVQSGEIEAGQMKIAIIIFSVLSLVCGLWLIYEGTKGMPVTNFAIFFILGIAAIVAAIKYTVGTNPYGYAGLGDLFVFLFFGLTGVIGSYYLHTQSLDWNTLLPASALGFLSTGVLNLNNLRDVENDEKSGKQTMVVRLGSRKAKIYHSILLLGALVLTITYVLLNFNSALQFLFLLTAPLLISNVITVFKNEEPILLDPLLKKLAMTTFAYVVFFGVGMIL